jgi:hypothetical protein
MVIDFPLEMYDVPLLTIGPEFFRLFESFDSIK